MFNLWGQHINVPGPWDVTVYNISHRVTFDRNYIIYNIQTR